MNETDGILTGGCQCGALRYELAAPPAELYACHCLECRKQSASAFGLSLTAPSAALRLTAGTPRHWSRPTDSGRTIRCLFCDTCGTRIWHESDPRGPVVSIKAGSLDQPVDLGRAIHIWTARRLPGVPIPPDAEQHPGEPG